MWPLCAFAVTSPRGAFLVLSFLQVPWKRSCCCMRCRGLDDGSDHKHDDDDDDHDDNDNDNETNDKKKKKGKTNTCNNNNKNNSNANNKKKEQARLTRPRRVALRT